MVNNWTLITIIVGAVLVIGYLLRMRRNASLTDAIIIFLATNGIVAGLKLWYYTFVMPKFLPESVGEGRTYIFIGGLAVIWVTVREVLKRLKLINSKPM